MLELLIRGGDVVTPEGVAKCDVGIAGERIAAIAAPDTLSAQFAECVIDATGRIVMPGGIDPHVHLKLMGGRDLSADVPTFFPAASRFR
jgi:dihydroorotase-like cyclic amidohydrolase